MVLAMREKRYRRWLRKAIVTTVFTVCLLLQDAGTSWAAGSNIGQNVGNLLKGYAVDLYGGIVAAFSLIFLWNRRYVELATFLFAAVVVAWMVFAPAQIGKAAEAIGRQIFG
jgi:hypothetical protein